MRCSDQESDKYTHNNEFLQCVLESTQLITPLCTFPAPLGLQFFMQPVLLLYFPSPAAPVWRRISTSVTEIDVLPVPGCNSTQYPLHLISKWHQIKITAGLTPGAENTSVKCGTLIYMHRADSFL